MIIQSGYAIWMKTATVANGRQKKINIPGVIPGQEFGNVFHETHQESDLQFCNESACHCFDLDRMLKQTA